MPIQIAKKPSNVEIIPPILSELSRPLFLEEVFYSSCSLKNLIIRGPFTEASGYAEVTRNLVLGLHELGLDFKVVFDHWSAGIKMALNPRLAAFVERQSTLCAKSGATLIHLSTPNHFNLQHVGYKIGYTMFEAEGIPGGWKDYCNLVDTTGVPTDYTEKYFREGGVRNLKILPIGINTKLYNPEVEKLKIRNAKSFKFLSVFQWTSRKGWDKLLTGYFRAFTNQDDVSLIIKSYVADTSVEAKQYIRKEIQKIVDFVCLHDKRDAKTLPQVLLYMDLIPIEYMPSFYNTCDCFVSATRGEGVNLPVLQAGACEKPIIATRGTAHMAFLDDSNSYLINSMHRIYEQVGLEHQIYKGLKVVDPDAGHLKNLLYEVYATYHNAKTRAKKLKEKIIKEWDYIETAKKWKSYLNDKKLI